MSEQRKLDMQNVEDILALTSMQEGILFHYLSNPTSKQYSEQLCLNLYGEVDIELIKKSWNFVAETNEVLRAIFRWEGLRTPVQIILKNFKVPLTFYDFSQTPANEQNVLIKNIAENDIDKGFDLLTEPFRVILCMLEENIYEMIISYHHILFDGWSNGIIINEFIQAYSTFNKSISYPKLVKPKFKEYLRWYNSRNKESQSIYWNRYLKEFEEKTQLPVDEKRVNPDEICNYNYILSIKMVEKINNFINKNEVTLASLIYTVWGILLQKYNNVEDVVFGTTISGRTQEVTGIDKMVGLFINTIPLRLKTNKQDTVIETLKSVNEVLIERQEYQHTPLVEIKSYSGINKNESLFDSIVVIENYPIEGILDSKDKSIDIRFKSIFGFTNFYVTLRVMVFDGIKLEFVYNSSLFKSDTIERLVNHYLKILMEVIEKPDICICCLSMLLESEKKMILNDFNDTQVDFGGLKTIKEMFEEQVKLVPDCTAVVYQGERITYRMLDSLSKQLAQKLHNVGIIPGDTVGILLDNSINMIVGILGVIMAGMTYLPIDILSPKERVAFILKDSGAKALITDRHTDNSIFDKSIIISMDGLNPKLPSPHLDLSTEPENIVYNIYTSGTTGKPKGIAIKDENLVNYTKWFSKSNKLTEKDKTVLLSSFCFDLGYTSIYPTLLSGGELHIVPREIYLDSKYISNYIKENNITYVKLTPSLFSTLVSEMGFETREYFNNTRLIVLGGEKINVSDVEKFNRIYPHVMVMNHYGPTETTIGCIAKLIDFSNFEAFKRQPVIGKPISNTQIFIVDNGLNLVPIGVPGEICISGINLARGYINDESLTNEKFMRNPFTCDYDRLYRTGDIGRFLANGEIEFLGRSDHQVKIRGFRVELKEIEAKLKEYKCIKDAHVIVRENKVKNKIVCAYIVSDLQISKAELKKYLSELLPEYMIPLAFIFIDKIPLTLNGKVDIKSLPDPNNNIENSEKYSAPVGEIEKRIESIWSEILGIDNIDVNGNFFDLGGNSILLINMHNKIEQYYPGRISVTDIFSKSTIFELSKLIESKQFTKLSKKTVNGVVMPHGFVSGLLSQNIAEKTNIYSILSHSLSRDYSKKLSELAKVDNLEPGFIILSVYIFLLGEISKQKKIEVQVIADNGIIFPMEIDLSQIEDFVCLFKIVSAEINKCKKEVNKEIKELVLTSNEKQKHLIIPAFGIAEMANNSEYGNLFDILMEVRAKEDYVEITLKYNKYKIVKNEIESFFEQVLALIQILIDEYND
ncbi:non-ribosomal peptide synthetase [Ruminiclostridium cellobioparum]|uniref:non-ribosomal peptide synthetase n=1 Tax=Ruminiclostridium cellobioparum TaxID=29355 RepID=UPI0028A705BC|nr:amino acid adenylation domain-containing protein [Ruminiclostridium cellobioparum]